MKRIILAMALAALTSWAGYAAGDVTVDGVVYHKVNTHYEVAGAESGVTLRSVHILGEVDETEVTKICDGAFEDDTDIESVIVDEGITSIGSNAFNRCYNLKAVLLPEGLEVIGEEAFSFCAGLTTFTFPSTVNDIGSHAFYKCTGVTDVYFLTDAANLDDFGWWDGIYHSAPQQGGGVEFNTNAHTVIHVPKGMLSGYVESGKFDAWLTQIVDGDDAYPLRWIVNHGIVGHEYTVSDALTAVYTDTQGDIYAKDDNGWLVPDKAEDGETDYMAESGLLAKRGNVYDQSNWVALRNVSSPQLFAGYQIVGGSVTGVLKDKKNPLIEVTSSPEKGAEANYVRNTYIATSLMGRTQEGEDGETYAFVRPKPQEVAFMEWALYLGDNKFGLPPSGYMTNINPVGFTGGFVISDALYGGTSMPSLVEDGYYAFNAILKLKAEEAESSAPKRRIAVKAGAADETEMTTRYDVFVVDMPEEPIITGITEIKADEGGDGIYYDLLGRPVGDNPVPGLYIRNGKKVSVK